MKLCILIVTNRVSREDESIASVHLSVRLFPLYLLNRPTFKLEFLCVSLKPRLHQQQCQSNIVERQHCWTILSTNSNAASTLLPFFWHQCRTKFRSFDKVETNWTCSVCFDFVERTKFHENLVRNCCQNANKIERCFDIVAGVDGV